MATTEEKRKDLIALIRTGQPVSLHIETGTDSKGAAFWRIPCAGGTYIHCTDRKDAEATLQMLRNITAKKASTLKEA